MTARLARSTLAASLSLAGCGDELLCSAASVDDPARAGGELVWEQKFAAGRYDDGDGIAVDPCRGRVVAVGRVLLTAPGTDELWVGVVSEDGEPLWDDRIRERFDSRARAASFDDRGSLVVVGTSEVGPYPGTDIDGGWIARFNPLGGREWSTLVPSDDPESDSLEFEVVAAGAEGRVFVAGRHGDMALAAAFSPRGELLWRHLHTGWFRAIKALPTGDVLFAGHEEDSLLLVRFSAQGELREELRPATLPDWPQSLSLVDDAVLVLVQKWLAEIRFDGEPRRSATLTEQPSGLAPGRDGDVYLIGHRYGDDGQTRPWVARLSHDLMPAWEVALEGQGLASAVAVDRVGDAVVVGRVSAPPIDGVAGNTNKDIWIARFARGATDSALTRAGR